MTVVLDARVVTRRGATVHEDVGTQFNRLSGRVWDEYAEKLRVSEESRCDRVWYVVQTHPDEDHLSALRDLRNAQLHNTVPSHWLPFVEALAEDVPVSPGHEFRPFSDSLHAWRDMFLTIATRATSKTSTPVSWIRTSHHGAAQYFEQLHHSDDTEWTDEKNQRRCELVDKEIAGTLAADEQIQLEQLQAEMLAYRRKVAPLPLDDLRELHQELLRDAGDQSE